ncbi:SRPBCC family protein [Nocardioides sp. JQ2195]|uniref:SRPBCC family protein n=1 Tax=Nocardioides sp. JQ2195 TaxID=2592334 RepID=UPI00143E9E27|nr:SRPBCC family protein [Nocardioides sp. JQ2195]QIX25422.1 SRPBCC family protein [Nocardioides sp. JQ2195]
MTFTVEVDFEQSAETVFAWLADLRNRPLWQGSLRAVDLTASPPYDVGTRWLDVTWPGLRPRMEVTVFEPGVRWAERGHWHGLEVDLVLDFTRTPTGKPTGTTVRAVASTSAPGWRRPIGWGLGLLGPAAARDDLRRAARLMARHSDDGGSRAPGA